MYIHKTVLVNINILKICWNILKQRPINSKIQIDKLLRIVIDK